MLLLKVNNGTSYNNYSDETLQIATDLYKQTGLYQIKYTFTCPEY